jgi:hypothetical protein
MKRYRLLAILALVVGFTAAAAAPALADNGAGQAPLFANLSVPCSTGNQYGTPGYGMVVIKPNNDGTISAVVQLRNATPNHTYNFEIVSTPSGTNCAAPEFSFTTNGQGNATDRVSTPEVPGDTGAFVLIEPSAALGFFASNDVTFN